MGILSRALVAALVALPGCYSPSLRDCTVSCASPDDCASGQVCGADGLCAAPGMAGRCGTGGPAPDAPDADAGPRDAPAIDAEPPDAMVPTVNLHVQVMGKGSVVVTGVGTCASGEPQKGDCTYSVAAGVARMARAIDGEDLFTRWSSLICSTQGATCTFTPMVMTTIAARFDHPRVDVR